jgi:hypothetical protein
MRRDVLITALDNVRRVLVATKAHQLFQFLARSRSPEKEKLSFPEGFLRDALESYAQFMGAYNNFGPEEKLVLKKFELDELVKAEVWISLPKPKEKQSDLSVRIRQIRDLIPTFVDLLMREVDSQSILLEKVEGKDVQQLETKKLTFLIRDSGSPNLTVRDLISILSDIENLFHSVVRIQNAGPSELIVTALDSGSEKSIDIVGVASAVDKLSGFILEAWDRIRFARANKTRASIKTASEGIALLNELKAAQDKGAIGADEGEKIRRTIVKSVDELFTKGVYTKQMETSAPLQPSQIEYQRTRLITHYSERAENNSDRVITDLEEPDDLAENE